MHKISRPAGPFQSTVRMPGDKSVSHRYAMLASVAEGRSVIHNYSSGADCHSTLGCVRSLGIDVTVDGTDVTVVGRGLRGYRAPQGGLDAGNSGSTIRMLSGLLAGQGFASQLFGDESLSRRPMARIIDPLTRMGARVEARDGKFPPLTVHGAELRPIDYTPPVPSAQVKSCVLLAGLHAPGQTTVREAVKTRDHTEIALREMGATVETGTGWASVKGPVRLEARELVVPGDLSSAAFFLVAGAIVPGAQIVIRNVGLNPSRARLLDFLAGAGVEVKVLDFGVRSGEAVGDLMVRGGAVKGGLIDGALAAALIDELPVLAVLGAVSEEGLEVRDAAELRVKETDRIRTVADNFRRLGVGIEERSDGFRVPGKQSFRSAVCDSFGDHRIAMACAVAGLRADGPVTIENAEAASVSFPEFWDLFGSLAAG